jgi:regulator of sigma E protease
LIQAGQLLLSLSILIAFHEGGHFIAARIFKTRVEKFYLFFDFLFPLPGVLNFALFKKKIGDTEYGLGWFPLGGYVQISGMIDESLDTEAMKKPAEPWEFRSKPAWQRLIIMLGGIIVNVILAFVIYGFVLFTWGEDKTVMSSFKGGVAAGEIAQSLGFKSGDKLVSVDGQKFVYYEEFIGKLFTAKEVQVEREGMIQTIKLPIDLIDKVAKKERQALMSVRMPFVIVAPEKGSKNEKTSYKANDKVVGINDSIRFEYTDQFLLHAQKFKNKEIKLNVIRGGTETVIEKVYIDSIGRSYFELKRPTKEELKTLLKIDHFEYGFFQSFGVGAVKCWEAVVMQVDQLKLMFTPSTGAYKHMGGFISIGKVFPKEWIWEDFWKMTALISMMLAFMNLLPIPALDGGHVLFTLWEIITRRAPSVKFLTYAQYVGMAFLLLLMLYANGNDIVGLFTKK